jgi:outer membrane protein TolC
MKNWHVPKASFCRSAIGVAILLSCAPTVFSQTASRSDSRTVGVSQDASRTADGAFRQLPQPVRVPEVVPTPGPVSVTTVGSRHGDDTLLIDLPAALRLADRVNPDIGISRQAISESMSIQQGARVLLLPSITGGANYHDHNGNLQRARGAILNLPAEQSLYFGGGARTLAAESVAFPAIRVFSHLGDAIFEPLAARQLVQVRRFDARATTNNVLLNVSTQYMELMGAEAQLEVLRVSQRNAVEITELTDQFARVGQARRADADRMTTEARLIESEIQRALERTAVAAAELARLLNLDPSTRLLTVGGPIPILELVDPALKIEQLLVIALQQRPEVAARSAEIAENQVRYRQERTRAWLPTISVGFSAGSFGGGSNLVDPAFGRFGGRSDFDVLAYWTAQNLGVGNVARSRQRRAEVDQAIAQRVRMLNRVRSEVAEAYAASAAQRQATTISERRLAEAEAGFVEEFNRIRAGGGLPIELLDNFSRLVSARQAIVTAIVAYDQSQFRLFVALGQPPSIALQKLGMNAALGEDQH